MKRNGLLTLIAVALCLTAWAAMGQAPATQPAPANPNGQAVPAPEPAPAEPAAAIPALGPGKGQVILSWDEFVRITGYDPARRGQQSLTVPWREVEGLLGVELKGKVGMDKTTVDLPWNDFKSLLEWSVRRKQGGGEAPPPADYIVSSSQYEGVLTGDEAAFTLKLKLNVLRKTGWKRIAVLPATVALTDSTLPDGVFVNIEENVYELLTEKTGPIEATLKFSAKVAKASGIFTVAFDRVLAGSSVLDLSLDGDPVDAHVAGAQSLVTKALDKKTHVAAAIPPAQPISIAWERAVPKIPAAPTRMYAETRTLAGVSDGVLVCQETVDFNILHTAVREIKLAVPQGASVLEVTGPFVQDWRMEKEGGLSVVFKSEVIGECNLRIAYEQAAAAESMKVPVVRAVGVERERGFVGVFALANVEITPGKVEGAAVIDVKQLPADIVAMTKQPILLGFRYVGETFGIELTVRKHGEVGVLVTIVDSALATVMQLNDGRRMTRILYTVRNNRNQFLRAQMPAGAEIWSASVSGNTVSPAIDQQKNVLIPLVRSAAGEAELASFPVEIVYVETPKETAPAEGKLHVALPRLDTPAIHVMVDYYAPAEGKYEKSGGLFASPKSGFSGTLSTVDRFAVMAADRAGEVVPVNAPKQAQAMQEQFQTKMENEARAAGVTPIRVRLPIDGKLFKLEKILALPGDDLYFDLEYGGWKAAR